MQEAMRIADWRTHIDSEGVQELPNFKKVYVSKPQTGNLK